MVIKPYYLNVKKIKYFFFIIVQNILIIVLNAQFAKNSFVIFVLLIMNIIVANVV